MPEISSDEGRGLDYRYAQRRASPRLATPVRGTLELFRTGYRLPLVLLGMTEVIEIFVYPDTNPAQGTSAAVLLHLMAGVPRAISPDLFVARRCVRS